MNSMVKLKNIKKNNMLIECDIVPEDSTEYGHVTVAIDTEELKSYSLPNGYEWCRNHVSHAQTALLEMVNSGIIPDEKLVKWN